MNQNQPAVIFDRVSKRFVLHHRRPKSLQELLVSIVKRTPDTSVEDFWALRDVDFEISRGEVISIIGHNGAGKTTLLKVLSRITEPTEGRIEVFGRVNSLLEVGTGFHPELTGRENIFLNGAILGMTRVEMRQRFDEIVAFAGVEKFIDTPVKRYSTGMYVRLAFAVAAHLEAEILVVDEVLAVGDAEFQAKCLNRMSQVASSGRTVLFVSHNFAAITALTKRSIVLHGGRVSFDGPVDAALAHYTSSLSKVEQRRQWGRGLNSTLIAAELLDEHGNKQMKCVPQQAPMPQIQSGRHREEYGMNRDNRQVTMSQQYNIRLQQQARQLPELQPFSDPTRARNTGESNKVSENDYEEFIRMRESDPRIPPTAQRF